MKVTSRITAGAIALLFASSITACATGPSSESPDTGGNEAAEGCEPTYDFTTMEEGVIQVAGMNELPSFLGSSTSGPFEGFSVELMENFAEQNCLTVEWTPGTGAATQLLAADGKVDVWVGIIIASPARAEVMNLEESQLYYEFAGIASKSEDSFTSVEDLQGAQVGAVTGSNYVPPLNEAVGEESVSLYQSSDEAYQDLAAGRIDAVITPSSPQAYWVSQNEDADVVSNIIEADESYPRLTQEYQVVWPVNKDNTELVEALSSYFEEVNENGEIARLLEESGIVDELHLTGRS